MPFLSMKIIFSKIMISLIEIGFADVFQRLCLTYFILFPFSGTSSQSSKKDGRRRSNTFIKDRPNSSMAAAGITFHRGFSHEDIWLLHQILIILMAQYSLHWRQVFMIVFPLTMSIKHQTFLPTLHFIITFHHINKKACSWISTACTKLLFYWDLCKQFGAYNHAKHSVLNTLRTYFNVIIIYCK